MIKVVARDGEGANEVELLRLLSSEPLKSDPDNASVPVLEFLEYDVWTFAVFPRWGSSVKPKFQPIEEGLDLCIQVSRAISFFHCNHIAHLDIFHENIVINFLGIEQVHQDSELLDFRSRFPVRYGIIDFGASCRFSPDSAPSSWLADVYSGRPHKAPELSEQRPYDPFAADVYQTGMMFFAWLYDMVPVVPRPLRVIQDMTKSEPLGRISISETYRRFCQIQADMQLTQLREPF